MTFNFTPDSILIGRINSLKVRQEKAFRKKQQKKLLQLQNEANDIYIQKQIDLLSPSKIGYTLSDYHLKLIINNCKIFKRNNLI